MEPRQVHRFPSLKRTAPIQIRAEVTDFNLAELPSGCEHPAAVALEAVFQSGILHEKRTWPLDDQAFVDGI